MHVGERVVVRVPPPEAGVQPSERRILVVDDAELIVVREVVHELAARVVRMSLARNVLVQVLEGVLRSD